MKTISTILLGLCLLLSGYAFAMFMQHAWTEGFVATTIVTILTVFACLLRQ